MRVDIIIPNYNGSHLIRENLPKVLNTLKPYKGKVIIVDDGSKPEDRVSLREVVKGYSGSEVELIEHTVNKGFSSAVNTGVRASTADYVVLLNSDVIPNKDFLKPLLEEIEKDPLIFGIGCMDESIEGEKTTLRGRGQAKWSRGMLIHERGDVSSSDTFWISGGSSIFRRELYMKLGGMDEIYNPFYWEDIDLSYRAQKSGYKISFNSKSVVEHLHEKGAIKKNFRKNKVTTIVYRNQFTFHWKNISEQRLLISHILCLPYHALGALKRGDSEFFKGLFLALLRLSAIIKKRSIQKKNYKLLDSEIIKKFE